MLETNVKRTNSAIPMQGFGLAPLTSFGWTGTSWQALAKKHFQGVKYLGRTATGWGRPTQNTNPSYLSQMHNLALSGWHGSMLACLPV
jgi:hypothetical protein